jgi:hypothetical protein
MLIRLNGSGLTRVTIAGMTGWSGVMCRKTRACEVHVGAHKRGTATGRGAMVVSLDHGKKPSSRSWNWAAMTITPIVLMGVIIQSDSIRYPHKIHGRLPHRNRSAQYDES